MLERQKIPRKEDLGISNVTTNIPYPGNHETSEQSRHEVNSHDRKDNTKPPIPAQSVQSFLNISLISDHFNLGSCPPPNALYSVRDTCRSVSKVSSLFLSTFWWFEAHNYFIEIIHGELIPEVLTPLTVQSLWKSVCNWQLWRKVNLTCLR